MGYRLEISIDTFHGGERRLEARIIGLKNLDESSL